MSSTPFRFVIVGSGNISRTYLNALGNLPHAKCVGIVSRRGLRPENAEASMPVFATLRQVDVPFEAVILCTPNGTHHQLAIEAASLGKHVLTEKVLDISVANMDAMTEACSKAGVQLAVSFQRRMSPDNRIIKQMLEDGALGRVFAADMRVKFYRDLDYYNSGAYRGGYAIDGGGPFMQQAAHNVDIFVWFFGMPAKVVSMLGTFVHPIEVEDHGVALMRYADGMIGTLTASSAAKPGFSPILEIHSDRGTVIMENDAISDWSMEGVPRPTPDRDFAVHSGSDSAAVSDTAGHEAIIQDFAEAVLTGREPAVPASQARLATELALKIYASNQSLA